jgi:hypothetical protein
VVVVVVAGPDVVVAGRGRVVSVVAVASGGAEVGTTVVEVAPFPGRSSADTSTGRPGEQAAIPAQARTPLAKSAR